MFSELGGETFAGLGSLPLSYILTHRPRRGRRLSANILVRQALPLYDGRVTLILQPREVVAPFEKEMHDWFGTPAWYRKGK